MQLSSQKNEGVPLLKASILVILLFQSCAMIARSFTTVQLRESGLSHLIAKDLSWLVVPIILGLLMLPILRENWSTLRTQFRVQHLTQKLVFVSVALGLILRFAQWASLIAIESFQEPVATSSSSMTGLTFNFACQSPGTLALTVLVSAIFTPLLEETINRGFILQTLLPRSRPLAIIVSAILFGIIHQPASIILASIIGIVLALQYINSGTLWACIVTHATYNALAILDWHCFQVTWNPLSNSSATKAVGSIALLSLLVSLALIAFLIQSRFYELEPGRSAPRS